MKTSSDCVDVQADLSLCWLHKSYCIDQALAHMSPDQPCVLQHLITEELLRRFADDSGIIFSSSP